MAKFYNVNPISPSTGKPLGGSNIGKSYGSGGQEISEPNFQSASGGAPVYVAPPAVSIPTTSQEIQKFNTELQLRNEAYKAAGLGKGATDVQKFNALINNTPTEIKKETSQEFSPDLPYEATIKTYSPEKMYGSSAFGGTVTVKPTLVDTKQISPLTGSVIGGYNKNALYRAGEKAVGFVKNIFKGKPAVQTNRYGYIEAPTALYQTKGTIGTPSTQYMTKPQPYSLKLSESLIKGQQKFGEAAGQTVKEISTFLGIPESKIGTTGYFPIAKRETVSGEPGQIYSKSSDIVFGPSEIGKGVQTFATVAPYGIPGIGQALLGAGVASGIETYKNTKVPTKEELIKQYQPEELTPSEWNSYIKNNPEGQAFNKQIDDYISSLKAQKRAGLLEAGLSAGFLVAPIAMKGTKFATEKVKFPLKAQAPIREFESAIFPSSEKTATGFGVSYEYNPPQYAKSQSLVDAFFGKQPKIEVYKKGRIDVGANVFKIAEDKTKAIGSVQRYSKSGTLKKYYESQDILQEVSPEDLLKLPKVGKYVAEKLPIRLVPEETQYGISSGVISPGKPFGMPSVRVLRESKGQMQLFLRTKPVKESELDKLISIGRVSPLPTTSQTVKPYFAEIASKTTKSISPRAAGNVDLITGKVYVFPMKEKAEETGIDIFIGKKGAPQLTALQTKTLALKAAKISSKIPKIKSSRAISIAPTEEFEFFPKYTGGLGKGRSLYYATGKAEEIEVISPKLPAVFKQSNVNANFRPTSYGLPSEKVKDVEFIGTGNKERSLLFYGAVQGPREKQFEIDIVGPANVQIPSMSQPQKERLKEQVAFMPRQKYQQKQIQVPRSDYNFKYLTNFNYGKPKPKLDFTFKKPAGAPKKQIFGKARSSGLFITEVRRQGKFFQLGAEPTLERAVAKGKAYSMSTLGASFKVKTPRGGYAPLGASGVFRQAKRSPFILVQKAPARLSSIGERAEIKASRRKGGFKL